MDREVVFAVLTCAVAGPALVAAAAWPRRHERPGSARQWEHAAWRAVWMPLLPAAIALFLLLGWVIVEPAEAERPPSSVLSVSAAFAAIWIRVLIRAAKAARPRRLPRVPCTVGLWRPRVIIDHEFTNRLDADALEAVLAHEAAHVRHRDPFRIWIAQIATDLQWPSARARARFGEWRHALELARDEETRESGIDGADLAAAILVGAQYETVPLTAATLIGSRLRLEDRIARLLAPIATDMSRQPIARIMTVVVVTCLLSAAAGAHFGESWIQTMSRSLP